MESDQTKSSATRHRIEIKVSEGQKELIVRGAAIAKQGISEFVRSVAEKAAREIISRSGK